MMKTQNCERSQRRHCRRKAYEGVRPDKQAQTTGNFDPGAVVSGALGWQVQKQCSLCR